MGYARQLPSRQPRARGARQEVGWHRRHAPFERGGQVAFGHGHEQRGFWPGRDLRLAAGQLTAPHRTPCGPLPHPRRRARGVLSRWSFCLTPRPPLPGGPWRERGSSRIDPLCRRKVPHVEAWFASSPRTGPLPLPLGRRGEAETGLVASPLTGPVACSQEGGYQPQEFAPQELSAPVFAASFGASSFFAPQFEAPQEASAPFAASSVAALGACAAVAPPQAAAARPRPVMERPRTRALMLSLLVFMFDSFSVFCGAGGYEKVVLVTARAGLRRTACRRIGPCVSVSWSLKKSRGKEGIVTRSLSIFFVTAEACS